MTSLWANVFKSRQEAQDPVSALLKRIPVFDSLNARDLVRIEKILHEREYRPEERIFLQGDPGLGMYIIIEGNVEIVTEPGHHLLTVLHEGEFFGELALLDESPRTATAIAQSPCRLLCLVQSDLYDLIDRNPKLGVKILVQLARTIGERLKKTNEYVYELKKELKGPPFHE
ncbi:MAG: cyclic nucleotide-binding domain-containing protein [Thermodesulfovibrio sp.]|nr:cyclic nucleotide-binding domain-containing protein [Thermodesulfovibrio sp.]